jgi:hypothetical protein
MVRAHVLAGILLSLAGPAAADGPGPLRKSLLGKEPPELVADAGQWLAGPPVSLAKLRGRVVWLQFNF